MKIKLPTLRKPAAPRTAARRAVPKPPAKIKLNAAVARRSARAIPDEEEYYDDEAEPNMKLSHAFVVVLVLHVIAVAGVFAFNTIKTRQSPVFADAATAGSATTTAETTPAATEPAATQAARTFEPRSTGTTATATAPAEAPAAPATSQSAAPASDWSGKTHEIRPGDTLTRLSSLYGVSIAAIQEQNAITDPTKIRVGTVLQIPAPGDPAPAAATNTAASDVAPAAVAAAPTALTVAPEAPAAVAEPAATETTSADPAPAAASGDLYEVVAGDNPWAIAKKLNVSYQQLIEVNQIEDPTKIQIGQKLKIPQ